MIARTAFALATLACLAGLALAGDICRGRPVVVSPGYHHAPAVIHKPYVHHDYAVPVVKVAVQPDYYYSVSDGYRDALLADAVAFRVLKAMQGQAAPSGPLPRYKEPSAPPAPAMPPAPPEAKQEGKPAAGLPSGAALAKVIESRCVKCHAGPGKNGIDLTDPDKVAKGQRWHAYALANSGEMPKGGQPIPDDEVKALYAWAQAAK